MELQNGYVVEEMSQSGVWQMGGISLFFSLKGTKKWSVESKQEIEEHGVGLKRKNAEQCID